MLTFLPSPYDVVPKKDRVIRVICGDDVVFTAIAKLGDVAATPANSVIRVCIADTVYSDITWWEGGWRCGVDTVSNGIPGLIKVTVPHEVVDALREGSYTVSVRVSDRLAQTTKTVASGSLQMEYTITSPQRSIYYRDDSTWVEEVAATPAVSARFSYASLPIPVGADSVDIPITANRVLASAPLLVSPDAVSPNIWITNVVSTPTGVTAYFGASTPNDGWSISYVLLEVSQ